MPVSKKKEVKGAEIDVTSVTGKNRPVDVLYVRLLNDKVHKTYELVEDEMLLDCNRDGEFVGVEILLPEKTTGAKRKPKAKKAPRRAKKVAARAKKAAGRVKKAVGRAKKAIRRAKRARSK